MIRLSAGEWTAEVRPELGGAVTALRKDGRDVLRPTPEGATDPLETACFPLTPYANRIANGRFVLDGREVVIPTLPAFAPHALHGDGWLKAWCVGERPPSPLSSKSGKSSTHRKLHSPSGISPNDAPRWSRRR